MTSSKPSVPRWRSAFSAFAATLLVTITFIFPAAAHAEPVTFNLEDAELTLSQVTFDYTGSSIEPSVNVEIQERPLTPNVDYTVSFRDNISPGIGVLTVAGIGDYYGMQSAIFAILQKGIETATITGLNPTYRSTGTAITPTADLVIDGTTLQQGTDYTVAYYNNSVAGTATMTFSGQGNYAGSLTATFVIVMDEPDPQPVSLADASIVLLQNAYLYTGSPIEPEFGVVLNGSTLLPGTHFTQSYSNNIELGTGVITITGIGNYTGTATTTFSIVDRVYTLAEVQRMMSELPNPIATLEDADQVVNLTQAVATLSADDLANLPNDFTDQLLAAQENARQVNQLDTFDGVLAHSAELADSWSVRLMVTPRTQGGSPTFFNGIAEFFAANGQTPLALFELKFIDTMTGTSWVPSEPVTITFTKVALAGWNNPVVIHQKSDGSFETLAATINGNTISFTAPSFSLFGVVADQKSTQSTHSTPALAKTGGNDSSVMMIGGTAALLLAAAGCALFARQRQRQRAAN